LCLICKGISGDSRYDFDQDGLISKEDIRIILSYVPMDQINKAVSKKEGKFTQEGGGTSEYEDRIEMQKQILLFLDNCFQGKQAINIEEFTKINEELSSEMLLSIMTLLQDKLPSSENFFRF